MRGTWGIHFKAGAVPIFGFLSRNQTNALAKVSAPARVIKPRHNFEVTANDRRFLRSLRIAADETAESVE